jgi:hypothetical protein
MALAKWHLTLYARRREDARREREEKRASRGVLIQGIGAGAAVTTVVFAVLKGLGVL